jgi:hypothetical protein
MEKIMPKGQQKGNRELKKPKQEKKVVVPVGTSILPSTKRIPPSSPKQGK